MVGQLFWKILKKTKAKRTWSFCNNHLLFIMRSLLRIVRNFAGVSFGCWQEQVGRELVTPTKYFPRFDDGIHGIFHRSFSLQTFRVWSCMVMSLLDLQEIFNCFGRPSLKRFPCVLWWSSLIHTMKQLRGVLIGIIILWYFFCKYIFTYNFTR